jgi:hypothetical protein
METREPYLTELDHERAAVAAEVESIIQAARLPGLLAELGRLTCERDRWKLVARNNLRLERQAARQRDQARAWSRAWKKAARSRRRLSRPISSGYLCAGCGRRFPVEEILTHVKYDCPIRTEDEIERALVQAVSALGYLLTGEPSPGEFEPAEIQRAIHLLTQMAATLEV